MRPTKHLALCGVQIRARRDSRRIGCTLWPRAVTSHPDPCRSAAPPTCPRYECVRTADLWGRSETYLRLIVPDAKTSVGFSTLSPRTPTVTCSRARRTGSSTRRPASSPPWSANKALITGARTPPPERWSRATGAGCRSGWTPTSGASGTKPEPRGSPLPYGQSRNGSCHQTRLERCGADQNADRQRAGLIDHNRAFSRLLDYFDTVSIPVGNTSVQIAGTCGDSPRVSH